MKLLTGLILSSCLLVGCHKTTTTDTGASNDASLTLSKVAESQKDSVDKINAESTDIINKATSITTESTKIDKCIEDVARQLPPITPSKVNDDLGTMRESVNKIQEDATNIKASAANVNTRAEDIAKQAEIVVTANVDVKKLEKKIAVLETQIAQLQADAIKKLYGELTAIFGIAFLAIIGGVVVAFFVDRKMGLMISAIGVLGIALAAASIFYLKAIAAVGIGIIIATLLVCVGLGIWILLRKNTEAKTAMQATKENVSLISEIRNRLEPEQDQEIFGAKGATGIAHTLQSRQTQLLVNKFQGKV